MERPLKRIEESLRRYQEIVEAAGEGVWTTDARGRTNFVNRRMTEILGYSAEELREKPGLNYCAPEYHAACIEADKKISQGYPQSYETELLRKDGQRIWVQVNGTPMYNQQARYIGSLGLYTNITERKKDQEKLRESQAQLQSLFDNIAEGVVLLDVEGNVLKINPVAARILRLDREHIARADFANMGWAGEVTLEDGTVLNQEYFELQGIPGTGKVIISEEAILRFPDGSQRWLRGSVTPLTRDSESVTGIIITFMDITGEKNQQEQLTQKLLEAQEIERKRIGRELHDDTAQSLSLISLELDSLAGSSRLCTEDVTAKLESLKTITDRTMQDVRRYSHELHPVILDHLGLVPALEQLAEDVSEHNGLKVDIAVQGEEIKLNPQEELALFRIAQEALSNIRKHAQATQARISLSYQLNSVNLRIIDNGIGFRVSKEQKAAISRGSLGLLSMKERAHLIGANLRIESTINQGTTIAVEIKAGEKNPGETPLL